jgi:hypothetical protein
MAGRARATAATPPIVPPADDERGFTREAPARAPSVGFARSGEPVTPAKPCAEAPG